MERVEGWHGGSRRCTWGQRGGGPFSPAWAVLDCSRWDRRDECIVGYVSYSTCVPQGATDAARAAADIVLTQPVGEGCVGLRQGAKGRDVSRRLPHLRGRGHGGDGDARMTPIAAASRTHPEGALSCLLPKGLSTIIEAIIVARSIFQRMQNYITYRIAATLQLLVGPTRGRR